MDRLFIIDGNSLINRSFYALPPLANHAGKIFNAVYGFATILARMITEHYPEYLCVAFDFGKHTFRNDMFKEYKGTRKAMPEELAAQLPILKDMLKRMEICTIEKQGVEADDIIGTLSKTFDNIKKVIITGDRDCLQLIDDKTEVWLTKHGITNIVEMNERHLMEEMGLCPHQIIELKALMGDSSDNIPGVKGIGEKGALNLLTDYKDVDNIYKNLDMLTPSLAGKLRDNKEMCYLSKDLATIRTNIDLNVELEDLRYPFPWNSDVADMFYECEFRSLLRRQDLFLSNSIKTPEEKADNIDIGINDVEAILQNFQQGEIALWYDHNDVHFTFDKKINYVVQSFGVTIPMILEKFKIVFENPKITLLLFNSKRMLHLLDKMGITLKCNYQDLALGAYLLDSNVREDELSTALNRYDLALSTAAASLYTCWEEVEAGLKKQQMWDLYINIELPLVVVLFSMEKQGICVDKSVLDELEPKYRDEMDQIKERIHDLVGIDFNVNSPKQLAEILFDKLGLSDKNNKKHSTAVDVLQSLRFEHPVIDEILRYRKIMKLYSTYIEGMRNYIGMDGKIHTIFNQTITVTGRLSSNEPNLQNIPVRTDEGKELRKMFVASKDCILVSADYNQIELRLLAHFSQDESLINAFRSGADIHTITAAQIFGVGPDMVTKGMRRSAKAVNFGIIYGISPYGLSQSLGCPVYQAREYIDRYFQTYPTIKMFLDSSIDSARNDGVVSTMFGRIRRFDKTTPSYRDSKFTERAAMNMPLQGTASDIIKIAMLRVYERLIKENLKAKLILQIHDELVVDSPVDEKEKVAKILKEEMENFDLNVPLTVEITISNNLFKA